LLENQRQASENCLLTAAEKLDMKNCGEIRQFLRSSPVLQCNLADTQLMEGLTELFILYTKCFHFQQKVQHRYERAGYVKKNIFHERQATQTSDSSFLMAFVWQEKEETYENFTFFWFYHIYTV